MQTHPLSVLTRSPLKLYRAGRTASKTIPGMGGAVAKGLAINASIFLALITLTNGSLYFLAMRPAQKWIEAHLPTTVDFLPAVISTMLLCITLVASLYLALRLSLTLMAFWYEALAEKVLHHVHPEIAELKVPFELWRTIKTVAKEIGLTLVFLSLNLLPIVGTTIALLCTAHRTGLSAYEPFRAVLREHDLESQRPKTKFLGLATILPGVFILMIGLIPVAGWIALWWITMHLVLGVAWRHSTNLDSTSPDTIGTIDPIAG